MKIHPSSIISPEAEISEGVEIGPYCYINGKVKIGRGTFIEAHATIGSRFGIVEMGENNHISPGAVIGGPPQDITYKAEPTMLIIGNNNVFREFSTVNIATTKEDRKTEVGNNNYLMSYTHIGHDCKVGNNVTVANDSHVGGHCTLEDNVTIGGACAFNQFVRIGKNSFVGGGSVVIKDILPYSKALGNHAIARATNKVGLLRKGYTKEEVENIHKALRILIMGSDTFEAGVQRIKEECVQDTHIIYLLNFIKNSKRGVAR